MGEDERIFIEKKNTVGKKKGKKMAASFVLYHSLLSPMSAQELSLCSV